MTISRLFLFALVLFVCGCNRSQTHETSEPVFSQPESQGAVPSTTASLTEALPSTEDAATYRGLLVSNHVLYLLATEAVRGAELVRVILPSNEVGHHQALRPSARKDMADASVIYWFGAPLETPLAELLDKDARAVSLIARIDTLPARKTGDIAGAGSSTTNAALPDPHLWLDPNRAKKVVALIAEQRAKQHPEHASTYKANVQQFIDKIDGLISRQADRLDASSSKTAAYVSYHDAYQYIEPYLGLVYLGSVVDEPELPIKPQRLLALKQAKDTHLGADAELCVLTEHENALRLPTIAPYHASLIDVGMAGYTDYVSGWLGVVQDIKRCVSL